MPIPIERLHELYDGVAVRSLRMETRQTYAVPWEDAGLAAWRRGEPEPPNPSFEEHLAGCRAIADSGRHQMRVRFLELPMTEYTRHEFGVYPRNVEAGEEIFVIDRAEHAEFDHVVEDFVVFDDSGLMYYRYTAVDILTGYDFSDDPADVAEHVALAEAVLAAAIPFEQWSREHG